MSSREHQLHSNSLQNHRRIISRNISTTSHFTTSYTNTPTFTNVVNYLRQLLRTLRGLFRYAPTRRYAALIALCAPVWLLSGMRVGETIAVAISAIVVLLGLIDAIRIPGNAHLTLTRAFPSLVGVGEEGEGTYTIQSRWPTPMTFSLSHALPPAVTGKPSGELQTIIEAAPVHIPVTITGEIRGVHTLGKAALSVRGPLGLMARTLIYYPNDTISVIPAFRDNRKYRLSAIQQRMRTAGNRTVKQRGTSTSFNSLRDYVIGDDPRHIDWKASARRGKLVSREFSIEQGQTIIIAVDAGRMMTQLAGARPRFEYALASALTLADVALTAGDYVGLLVFNEEVREFIPPSKSSGTLLMIRDALVRSSATVAEPDYAAAFRTLAAHQRRRALIVLLTDVIDIRSSRAVIANTTRSVARHLPLVVALKNEQLISAALPTATADDLTTYTSSAAEELLSARDEVLLSMRQAGVSVLDAAPETLTASLINRYLEIKDRALL